jgi:hypothetical protein
VDAGKAILGFSVTAPHGPAGYRTHDREIDRNSSLRLDGNIFAVGLTCVTRLKGEYAKETEVELHFCARP